MRSSGASPTPALTAAGTEPRRSSRPVTRTVPGGRPPRTVEGLEDLRAAGADEPGETDDLARSHAQVDAGEDPRQLETGDLEDRVAGRLDDLAAGREDVLDGAARHQLDQLARRGLVDGEAGRDGAAVLEDGDPIADLADLLEPVRDVDDGDTLGGEVADHAEQVVDLALVEDGGRLVEDEQPGVVGEGARHADDLLGGGREPADRAGGRDLGVPEPGEQLARPTDRLPALAEAGGAELVAEEDVLGDAEVGNEVELLVDRGDARGPSRSAAWTARPARPPTGSRPRRAGSSRTGS